MQPITSWMMFTLFFATVVNQIVMKSAWFQSDPNENGADLTAGMSDEMKEIFKYITEEMKDDEKRETLIEVLNEMSEEERHEAIEEMFIENEEMIEDMRERTKNMSEGVKEKGEQYSKEMNKALMRILGVM